MFSDPYQDIHTGMSAQTAVLVIDESRVLLADLRDDQQRGGIFSGFTAMPASWIPDIE